MLKNYHPTEDKLIILYVLKKIKTGITKEQLSLIVVENLQFNYFDIQLIADDLIKGRLIEVTADEKRELLTITADGKEVLTLFEKHLPLYICEMIDLYLDNNKDRVLTEVMVRANYKRNTEGDYQVDLSLYENKIKLMAFSINTPSHEQAVAICDKWKNNTQELYASVIRLLT